MTLLIPKIKITRLLEIKYDSHIKMTIFHYKIDKFSYQCNIHIILHITNIFLHF